MDLAGQGAALARLLARFRAEIKNCLDGGVAAGAMIAASRRRVRGEEMPAVVASK
jgi:hypothetical protein